MIRFCIFKTNIRFDFTFFASTALFMLTENGGFGMSAFIACALHEMSHLILMIIFGIPAKVITFYGAGIRISSDEIEKAPAARKTAVLLAGSAGNFIFAAMLFLFGMKIAAFINLFTGAFNLLPIGDFDGAGLLRLFAVAKCRPENVDRVMRLSALASSVLLAGFVIFFAGAFSASLVVTATYLILLEAVKKRAGNA